MENFQDAEEDFQELKPVQKICYYELLGLKRSPETTTEDIKKAYKFAALKNHPDKNKDKPDAKDIFQQINVAYNCLIDPNERTWYDNHRQQILSGKTKKEGHEMSKEDKEQEAWGDLKIHKYSTDACYKGFTDEPKGFYTVFRNLFEKLKDLEEENSTGEVSKRIGFGDMNYDLNKVNQFYEQWESFNSNRTFDYADINNPAESQNRWEKREIEKENKKERQLEKTSYIKTVKTIVQFAKKRDPRQRNAEIFAKQEEQAQRDQKKQEIIAKKNAATLARQQELAEKQKQLEEQRRVQQQREEEKKKQLQIEEELRIANMTDEERLFYCEDCNIDFSRDYMPKQMLKKHCDTKEHRKKAEVRLIDKLKKAKSIKTNVVFQPREKDDIVEEAKTQEPIIKKIEVPAKQNENQQNENDQQQKLQTQQTEIKIADQSLQQKDQNQPQQKQSINEILNKVGNNSDDEERKVDKKEDDNQQTRPSTANIKPAESKNKKKGNKKRTQF